MSKLTTVLEELSHEQWTLGNNNQIALSKNVELARIDIKIALSEIIISAGNECGGDAAALIRVLGERVQAL